jgi:hypothetical protein
VHVKHVLLVSTATRRLVKRTIQGAITRSS